MSRAIKSISLVGAAICAIALGGCGGIGLAYEKKLSGNYALVATDVLEQMDVSKMLPSGSALGVIPATVFAVGWDNNFIIAKQHPNDAPHHIDKSVANFYILRVIDGSLTGPLDESAFQIKRKELQVREGLVFTLVFDELK
jgi:hypothetical protein